MESVIPAVDMAFWLPVGLVVVILAAFSFQANNCSITGSGRQEA